MFLKKKSNRGYFAIKRRADNISGYMFLLPAIIGFVTFIGAPLIMTTGLVFFDYNLIKPLEFVGLANIERFVSDPLIKQVFTNTVKFFFILVPVHVVLGLALAYFTYSVTRFKAFYRSVIYFPTVVTTASVAIVWNYMFSTDLGLINYYVRMLGGENIPWLTDQNVVYLTIAIFSFWKFVGNAFLYYFIGLQNIPTVYYEAAKIDGAGSFRTFFKITLPLLTPTVFFVIITNCIGVFQIFDEPYLLTGGGPGTATRSVAYQIYETAFKQTNIGYGATIAVALFLIVLVITIIQFTGQKKWVNYDYE